MANLNKMPTRTNDRKNVGTKVTRHRSHVTSPSNVRHSGQPQSLKGKSFRTGGSKTNS